MGIVKLGIEPYVLHIHQLINLEVSLASPDLKLLEKCQNVDFPHKSSCGTALEKYIQIPGMNAEYVNQVSTTLVSGLRLY